MFDVIGVDTAKNVFQLHGVDHDGAGILRKKITREEFLPYFQALPRSCVGMEACAASHHWARQLTALGHDVKLIPAQYVKPFVKHAKNDATDAAAFCEAMRRPDMAFVPMRSAENQAALGLLTMRD
ncbi:IS110 family transposase [Sphingorhabdus contaminans]|uniref:Transposase n=1 Tax=Sphingorhabdus contaminans TaxID=1343899 RepID=A0A553WA62_9SPHN|nr:transposase [Sphingorhabdus contaminans]TSB01584.1 transposase [Sphingorhabdus contaminans]